MRLFIDDERFPTSDDWVIARSYEEAIEIIETFGCPTFISFDNDLGEGNKEGFLVANYIVEKDMDNNGMFIPDDFQWYVHSQNPVRRDYINGYLKRYLEVK